MIITSEDVKERYRETAKAADAQGRIITVGRLKVSQKLRISGMTQDLEGSYEVKAPNGTMVEIPRRAQPMLAAMVRQIDDFVCTFPRNRAELDAMMDVLDDEGFTAIMEANSRLNPAPLTAVDGDEESRADQLKN
jgi:hypothetical protein